MIIRGKRPEQFTVIPNTILDDPRIDWRDLGLLVYLLSKPDNWSVMPQHLANQRRSGRDAIYRSLHQLQEAGYVKYLKQSTGKGDWIVYDNPPGKAKSGKSGSGVKPNPENPDLENPDLAFATLVNTENTVNTEKAVRHKKFTPPSLSEVKDYVNARRSSVDPVKFHEYYETGDWKDKDGKPVKNWKQRLISWEGRNESADKPKKNVVAV